MRGSSCGSTTQHSPRRIASTPSLASAASRGCARYGGKISSEWFYSKSLQILDEASRAVPGGGPADRGRRLGGLAAHRRGDPQQLHRRIQGDLVQVGGLSRRPTISLGSIHASRASSTRRCRATSSPSGSAPARLSAEAARWTGLRPGTAVAVANVDAHVSVPAVTVTGPGQHGRGDGHEHLPPRAGRPARRWSRACAASWRTASCRGCSASKPASRPLATSLPGSSSTAVPPAYHAGGATETDVHAQLGA